MAELTIGQLIKIILAVLVIGVVVYGVYVFFKDYVIDFFSGMVGGQVFRAVLK